MTTSSTTPDSAPLAFVTAAPAEDPWRRIARSRSGAAVAGWWGLGEALCLVFTPAAWLGLVALRAPRRVGDAILRAMLASILGGLLVFGLANWVSPSTTAGWAERIPAVTAADVREAEVAMRADGLTTMIDVPAGRPFALESRAAGVEGKPWYAFLGVAFLNRLGHFVPLALAFALLGLVLREFLTRFWRPALIVYAGAWAIYWMVTLF